MSTDTTYSMVRVHKGLRCLLREARRAGFRASRDERTGMFTVTCLGSLYRLCDSSREVVRVLSEVLKLNANA